MNAIRLCLLLYCLSCNAIAGSLPELLSKFQQQLPSDSTGIKRIREFPDGMAIDMLGLQLAEKTVLAELKTRVEMIQALSYTRSQDRIVRTLVVGALLSKTTIGATERTNIMNAVLETTPGTPPFEVAFNKFSTIMGESKF